MSGILVFVRKWNASHRVLRYGNRFSFVDSCTMGCGWRMCESRQQ
jgi:hypothetical protein